MTIRDNPNLVLTLTMHADDEEELEWMLSEVAVHVGLGSIAGNGGGCSCSYVYSVDSQTRDAQQLEAFTDEEIHNEAIRRRYVLVGDPNS